MFLLADLKISLLFLPFEILCTKELLNTESIGRSVDLLSFRRFACYSMNVANVSSAFMEMQIDWKHFIETRKWPIKSQNFLRNIWQTKYMMYHINHKLHTNWATFSLATHRSCRCCDVGKKWTGKCMDFFFICDDYLIGCTANKWLKLLQIETRPLLFYSKSSRSNYSYTQCAPSKHRSPNYEMGLWDGTSHTKRNSFLKLSLQIMWIHIESLTILCKSMEIVREKCTNVWENLPFNLTMRDFSLPAKRNLSTILMHAKILL